MKTLYFECYSGAAGDMLMAALLELHDNQQDFLAELNAAGIPGVTVSSDSSVKCGIKGTQIRVAFNGREENEDHPAHERHGHHHHEHSHKSYHDIDHLIGRLNVSDTVKKNAVEIYRLIAEAESHVHGVQVNQIHFHELGDMDAVADIVGVCMLMEKLAPDLVLASPVNTGSGHVKCAHGLLPVPAPATAYLLQNIPIYNTQIVGELCSPIGELCTPTGAALLKYFVKKFCQMPLISASKTGYGMGKKDFAAANCVRAFLGETDTREEVVELVCNLDDMTPEAVSFARQILLDEGALDVYTIPIGMKKSRAGICLICMCNTSDKDKMISLVFRHTATLGIREYTARRYTLQKEMSEVQTQFGPVRVKTSFGFGVKKSKPEYEDIARIAREKKKPFEDIMQDVLRETMRQ